MSQYYKPHRNPKWNYGGPNFKLSRSRIDLFLECPRCFYLDNKLGVARPRGYPFSLNAAVDHLLKKEFDVHRKEKTAHPLMETYGIDAVPYESEHMDAWRDNFTGVQHHHKLTGFTIFGAVDDVWVDKDGRLIVVDYKATSKDGEVTLDADWQEGYKRQMEVYQWLLRQNSYDVSDTGYFVYANGVRDNEAFDKKLEFDVKIIPYTGDASWVEITLTDIKETLESENIPEPADECEYCQYRKAVRDVAIQYVKDKQSKNKGKSTSEKLF